ncbi:MAG: hypothetical protein AAF236_16125 [Verrucomicrobiota bacterium]
MKTPLTYICAGLLLSSHVAGLVRGEEEDPGDLWVRAYGWISTAERLGEAEQWPLSIAAHIEAFRSIGEIEAIAPDFEPELIAFRAEKIEQAIEEAREEMGAGDHDVMMKFLDVIESIKQGEKLRYSEEYEAAAAEIDFARSLLDEISELRGEGFRHAVSGQYLRIDQHSNYLNSQILHKEASRVLAKIPVDNGDLGTTEFVKLTDLPKESDAIAMSASLFPPWVPEPEERGEAAAPEPASSANERFQSVMDRVRFGSADRSGKGSEDAPIEANETTGTEGNP